MNRTLSRLILKDEVADAKGRDFGPRPGLYSDEPPGRVDG